MSEHLGRNRKHERQQRTNQLTALFVGMGTGLAFALLFWLLLRNWTFAVGVGVVVALAVALGLNAIRKDSRKIADDEPEAEL